MYFKCILIKVYIELQNKYLVKGFYSEYRSNNA